jgi:hypothetical protein
MAEETHFYLDYSKGYLIGCLEFNHHGPRLKDIEYYLRNIARDTLKEAKATKVDLYMDSSIGDFLKNIKEVLHLDVKVQPKNLSELDAELKINYFNGLTTFGSLFKPEYMKLEAGFQVPGNAVKSQQINKSALRMVKDVASAIIARPENLDALDNFVVKYTDSHGEEAVFNLLKGKKEITIQVDFKKIKKKRDLYELVENDFDKFIQEK